VQGVSGAHWISQTNLPIPIGDTGETIARMPRHSRGQKSRVASRRTCHVTENMTIRLRGNFGAMRKAKKWDAEAETGTLDKPASTSL